MNDNVGNTASCLAITEKKPQKVGGCVGIFVQLFDWNKRLAKKKLFSKKLLPGVRSKQSSKKFGGDDKQSKLHLIADENSGGFPNVSIVDNGKKSESRAPSLVAKLMGLDSMPAMQKSKSRKGFGGNGSGRKKLESEELILERVDAKRPQKAQKTGLSEERPVGKLGADHLQIETILSRSRKNQIIKTGSPVKSPRSSAKNALIDAATRILEPGLQKSRSRYALTYSNTSSCRSNYEYMTDERAQSLPEQPNSSSYPATAAGMIPNGQSSCTNCGVTVDILNSESSPVDRASKPVSPVPHYVDFWSPEYEMSQPRRTSSYPGMEDKKDESLFSSTSQLNTSKRSYDPTVSRNLNKEGQVKWQLSSQPSKSQKDLKQKTQMQNQRLLTKDRKPVKSKLSSVQGNRVSGAATNIREIRSFAPLGQISGDHPRYSDPGNVDDWKYELERKARIRRKDSTSSIQKKRPTNFHKKYEGLGSSSDPSRQFRIGSAVISEKEARYKAISHSCHQSESTLSKSGDQRRTGYGVKKVNGCDSFMFTSSAKYMTQRFNGTQYCRVPTNSSLENTCEDDQSIGLPKPISITGDALTTLLEQKLQELTSQGEDDSADSGSEPKKTTAMILQELICALTTEQHFHDHSVGQSNRKLAPCYNYHCLSNADTSFRFKAQNTSPPMSVRDENDDNQRLSPGSVLEASFSIDSSSSSNHEDVSNKDIAYLVPRNKRVFESTSFLHGEQNTWETDADLLESTISQRQQTRGEVENRLLNNVTDMLCSISVTETSLVGSKLNHARSVLLDAELILANEGFPISHFLYTELETFSHIIRVSFSYTRSWNQVKGFAFDSAVQYLESRYTQYSKCGFSAWSSLPLHMDSEIVILEIIEEIRRWTELAGMTTDDLVEWDMSHSLGKWTEFEAEAFETGVELDQQILETLVDELVIDLCKCK